MTELSNTFVCVMGMGTVFVGLILIVLICKLIGAFTSGIAKSGGKVNTKPAAVPQTAPQPVPTGAEKAKLLAGICACIAEELGTEADNIKVTSFKRV